MITCTGAGSEHDRAEVVHKGVPCSPPRTEATNDLTGH